MTVDPEVWFQSFSGTNFSVIPFHFIVIVITLLTCVWGAHSIEKANKIMMQLFFVLFVILAIRVAFLPNAVEGYKFMIKPDWQMLKESKVLVGAMGRAFFSLSITGSKKKYTKTWYYLGKFIYVPMAIILCFVALYFKIAF